MNRFSREKTPIDVAAYLSNTQQEPFSSLTYDVYRFLKKCNLSFFILRRKKGEKRSVKSIKLHDRGQSEKRRNTANKNNASF